MKLRWLISAALTALVIRSFCIADTASARSVMPEFLLERMNAVSSHLEKQGYERGSTDFGKAKSSGFDVSANCLRYTQWFTKNRDVKPAGSQNSLLDESYGESTLDKISVTIYYPDWLGVGEACGKAEFPGVIGEAFSKVRKHYEAVDGENRSGANHAYNEDIKRVVYTNAPDGNYELNQTWFRISGGPARDGWNVSEGSWSMFHQPWKELDEYDLNASVRLYGTALSSEVPFAFQILTSRHEDTDVKPGGGGKLSEDISKDGFWKPMRGTAEKVMGIILSQVPQKPDSPAAPAAGADAPEPGLYLGIEASPTSLPADGKSRSVLTVSTYEVDEKTRERKPLAGKKVDLSVAVSNGIAPGTLSAQSVTTGKDGTATAVFIAPARDTIEGKKIGKAMVVAGSSGFGKDDVNIQLETFAPLTVKAEHQILPAGPSFISGITFTFGAPGENQIGKDVVAVITVASGGGRLAAIVGQDGKGAPKLEIKASPGVENRVYYHWAGDQPKDRAEEETVTVEIPSMGYKGSISFSVGVDLALTGGGPLSPGTVMPGLFVPYRIFVHDRFHKDADLGVLFKAFGIEPSVTLVQTGYKPLPAMDAREDFYAQLAAHIQGSASPGDLLSWDVLTGAVRKDKDGGWIVVWKDYEGKGLTDRSLPGLIAWRRGHYSIEARLDSKWKGDATQVDHVVKLEQFSVEGKGKSDAEMESFIIPTLKSYISLFPSGGTALMTVDVSARLARTGDYAEALKEVGKYYALDFLGGKLTQKVQGKLEGALEKYVWGSDRGKWLQDRLKGLVAKANDGVKGLEKMTAEQIDQCIDMGKESLAGYLAGSFADTLLSKVTNEKSAVPGIFFIRAAWADENVAAALKPLEPFLKGYAAGSLLLVEKKQLEGGSITSGGKVLEKAPKQVFAMKNAGQRLYESGAWVVLALRKGETVLVALPEGATGTRACIAGPGGVKAAVIGPGTPLGNRVSISESGFGQAGAGKQETSAPAAPAGPASAAAGVVTGSGVRIRADHGLEGKQVGTAGKGETVAILEKWTSPSDMAIIREDCTGTYDDRQFDFKKGMGVHVIEWKSGSEEVIVGIMQDGKMAKYGLHMEYVEIQKEQTWYLIRTGKGLEGWIYGEFVDVGKGPSGASAPGPEVQALYRQAVELMDEEKTEAALSKFDQVLKLYPGHVDALFDKGRSLFAMKRYDKALDAFGKIPLHAPSQPLFLAWMGYCYQEMKQYDKALLAYAAVLKLHPRHDIIEPVSDSALECLKILGLPENHSPDEEKVKAFIFGRWDAPIAGEIWKGSTRGQGLWDTF